MKKITLLFLGMFPALLFAQEYTTPGTGVNYSIEDLMALTPSTINNNGDGYQLLDDVIIAETDTLEINSATNLLLDEEVRITVHGTFISNAGEEEITIDAIDELAPYNGFWFSETAQVKINNTNIQNGGGLKVITPDFELTNSYLAYNVSGAATGSVVSLSNGSPLIQGNTFFMNDLPAVSAGANQEVAASIIDNHIEANVQNNENRPQINMAVTGTDTLRIIQNTIIGDPAMTQVGGISVANFVGGELRAIIDNNIIRNNRYGITILGGAFAYIRGNIIEDNNTQNSPMLGGSGISLNSATDSQNIIASNNEFRGNLWGITVIEEASINLGDGEDNPGGNIFSENGNGGVTYAIYNNTDNTTMAMNNCWIEGEEITLEDAEEVIFHQVDDATLGEVIFDPVNCENLSVGDIALENFSFYPNPASANISFDNLPNFEKLQIYSISGQLLREVELSTNYNEISLDLSSGVYILKFNNKAFSISKKLLVE